MLNNVVASQTSILLAQIFSPTKSPLLFQHRTIQQITKVLAKLFQDNKFKESKCKKQVKDQIISQLKRIFQFEIDWKSKLNY